MGSSASQRPSHLYMSTILFSGRRPGRILFQGETPILIGKATESLQKGSHHPQASVLLASLHSS